MVKLILTAMVVIVPVALLTGLIVSVRIDQIAEPEKIREQGLETVRAEDSRGFGFIAVMFGLAAALVYVWLASRWPAAATNLFLALGLGLAVILSVAAAVVRPRAGLGGVGEVVALNMIWGLGYGWVMPLVLRFQGVVGA